MKNNQNCLIRLLQTFIRKTSIREVVDRFLQCFSRIKAQTLNTLRFTGLINSILQNTSRVFNDNLGTIHQHHPIEIESEPQIGAKYIILYVLIATLKKGKPGDINSSNMFF